MKVQFEFEMMTARIVAAMQELNFAIAEVRGAAPSAVPSDNGKYKEWSESTEAIAEGKTYAEELVAQWSVNWQEDPAAFDDGPQPIPREKIVAEFKGKSSLVEYLRHNEGAVANLQAVGASEQMAKNIVAVGGIFGAWPLVSVG